MKEVEKDALPLCVPGDAWEFAVVVGTLICSRRGNRVEIVANFVVSDYQGVY